MPFLQTSIYPATAAQAGMVLHGQEAPGSGCYVQQFIIRWNEGFDADSLEAAWRRMVGRYEVFRTRFVLDGEGRLLQHFEETSQVCIVRQDLGHLGSPEQARIIEEYLRKDRQRGFRISDEELSRFVLFSLGDAQNVLIWTSHHAILDGRARVEVLRELLSEYESERSGLAWAPKSRPPFFKHLQWLENKDFSSAKAFWKSLLEDLEPDAPLNLGFPQGSGHSLSDDGAYGVGSQRLDAHTTQALRLLSERYKVTMSTMVHAAWALLLSRYTGMDDVVFGAVRASRYSGVEGGADIIGPLVNTVPVRALLKGSGTLGDLLTALRGQWVAMREHEHLPLSEILATANASPGAALFETVVMYEHRELNARLREVDSRFQGLDLELRAATHYALTLSAFGGDQLLLELGYDRRRLDDVTSSRILRHLVYLLHQMADGEDRNLAFYKVLPPDEEETLLRLSPGFKTGADTTEETRPALLDVFVHQVSQNPDAVALETHERQWSYAGLDGWSGALAERLTAAGVRAGEPVAISANRSPGMIAGILGILKAGGVYMPIDLEEPAERVRWLLQDAGVRLLLVGAGDHPSLSEAGEGMVLMSFEESGAPLQVELPTPAGPLPIDQREWACILYTSGSTGAPKGVCVRSSSVVGLVTQTNYLNITAADVVAQAAHCCFDASTLEIWGALLNGARLTLLSRDQVLSANSLSCEIQRRGVTFLFLTTGLFHELARQKPDMFSAVKHLITGGDVLLPEVCAEVLKHGAPGRLTNGYGPTETTTFATFHDVTINNLHGAIPIGRPISRSQVLVLDQHLGLTPSGVAGEIYIGGGGLSTGYLNRPELTAEKFIPHPYSPGARLYRTGDWGRWREDGTLEYLGRKDNQIKIRGLRVELGEIEAALMRHPHIRVAAVTMGAGGSDCSLVAHLVPASQEPTDVRQLRTFLSRTLPTHMVPVQYFIREALPLTRNGKVDRDRLVRELQNFPLKLEQGEGEGKERPVTAAESSLLGIWSSALLHVPVGVEDDFFELGGNSLLAMRIAAMVEKSLGVRLPVSLFARLRTVREQAEWMEAQGRAGTQPASLVAATPNFQSYPLTLGQHRFWTHAMESPHLGVWNVVRVLLFRGEVDTGAMREAFRILQRRHEALRVSFVVHVGGLPVQVLWDDVEVPWEELDLQSWEARDRESHFRGLVRNEVLQPFHLERAPLCRIKSLKLAPGEHALILAVHHCVCDGASLALLLEELGTLYSALVRQQEASLPSVHGQITALAEWERKLLQQTETLASERYWREFLSSLPPPVLLPTDGPDPERRDFIGCTHTVAVEPLLLADVEACARRNQSTRFMVLFAAFAVFIRTLSGRQSFAVISPVNRRSEAWMDRLIGHVVQATAVQFNFRDEITFADLLAATRASLLKSLEHQAFPMAEVIRLAQEICPERMESLGQLDFVDVPTLDVDDAFHGLITQVLPVQEQTIRNELRVMLVGTRKGMEIRFDYPLSMFQPSTICSMADMYLAVVARMVKSSGNIQESLVDCRLDARCAGLAKEPSND